MVSRHRLARSLSLLLVLLSLGLGLFFQTGSAQVGTTVFVPQKGTPIGIQNFVFLDKGCNWSGVGGQVFSKSGTPITGLVIKLAGKLEGQNILYYAVTGGSLQFGPGGFLIDLTDHPVASKYTATLQVLEITGLEKSAAIPLVTYGDCAHNMLLVNIRELPILNPIYFPIIRK
jgi:hypothetical protein